jgi:glycosyltransferase involved in cell wall biosynthesis
VGTRVDGFPETLAAGRGLIVEPGDPAALATALEDAFCGRRTTDLVAARAWARQFDTERVASLYERDYLELHRAVAA